MAGGIGSFIINKCAGSLFTYAEAQGAVVPGGQQGEKRLLLPFV